MKEEFHEKNILLSCAKDKKLLVAYEIAKTDITVTNDNVKTLWLKWYPEDVWGEPDPLEQFNMEDIFEIETA